eukprot:3898504-Amphidinium_carterae.2
MPACNDNELGPKNLSQCPLGWASGGQCVKSQKNLRKSEEGCHQEEECHHSARNGYIINRKT